MLGMCNGARYQEHDFMSVILLPKKDVYDFNQSLNVHDLKQNILQ